MLLTIADLVDHICKTYGMSKKQAAEAVEAVLEIIKSNLEKARMFCFQDLVTSR